VPFGVLIFGYAVFGSLFSVENSRETIDRGKKKRRKSLGGVPEAFGLISRKISKEGTLKKKGKR